MPAIFKKIKVTAKSGRGDGDFDEMMNDYLKNDLDTMIDGYQSLSQGEKDAVKAKLDGFEDGLGTALDEGKEAYELALTDVSDKEGFFKVFAELQE